MEDWVPTLMAAAGEPDVKEKLLTGHKANGKTFKVHLDGYDQTELLAGQGPSKRKEIFYFDDQGSLNAIRYGRWKIHFTLMTDWINGGKQTGWPKVVDLRADPFERAMEDSDLYLRWYSDKMWTFVPAQAVTARFLGTFKEFPQRQKLPSFNLDAILSTLSGGSPAGN
jgi:arylsulfatase